MYMIIGLSGETSAYAVQLHIHSNKNIWSFPFFEFRESDNM